MKVLIADDSPTTRFVLKKNLINWGYEVIEAEDGMTAYEYLNDNDPPRIAILDWNMPGMDGVSICKEIRNNPDKPFIYKILLTSRDSTDDLVYALDNGAHNFQSKPFKPIEIRSHIKVGHRLVESDDKMKEYAQMMQQLATVDPLTNAFNRRYFMDHAEMEFKRSLRYLRPFSIVMIDLDHFKKINDTYGHAAGDEVLKSVTQLFIEALRNSDILGRIGGEEFAIILPETNEIKAMEVAERIRAGVNDLTINYNDIKIHVSVSMGVSSIKNNSESLDELLKKADKALYSAKDCGRNVCKLSD